jgi:hypothetical protein
LQASIICISTSLIVNPAVSFNCLDFKSTISQMVTQRPAGASWIPVCSLLIQIIGLYSWCQNCRCCSMPMFSSARHTQQTMLDSLLNTIAHSMLYGSTCPTSGFSASICEGVSVLVSKLETLLCGTGDFCTPDCVDVMIVAGC